MNYLLPHAAAGWVISNHTVSNMLQPGINKGCYASLGV